MRSVNLLRFGRLLVAVSFFAVARGLVESLREAGGIPGMSVAVGIDRSIVWTEAFGLADVERAIPATPATRFRIASLSKLLSVSALARLQERGVVDLDAPVSRYVRSWPDKGYPITLRQLAGHLGGVRGYRLEDFEGGIESRPFGSVSEALALFEEDPLESPPGTAFLYSSYGYTLLSAAMESASGKGFLDLVREEVLDPLDLARTAANRLDAIPDGMTSLYARDDDGNVVPVPNLAPSYKWAAGGYVSTAEDMARFGLAHLRPGYLEAKTRRTLFASQRLADGTETGVGIGWMSTTDPWGRRVVFHNGSQAGARAVLMAYPRERLVVVVLANLTGSPRLVEGTAMGIAELFLHDARGRRSPEAEGEVPGFYRYGVGAGHRASSGTVDLREEDGRYVGVVTRKLVPLRPPLDVVLERGGDGGLRGVLAAPEGFLLLDLKAASGGFDGRLVLQSGVTPVSRPFRLERELQATASGSL